MKSQYLCGAALGALVVLSACGGGGGGVASTPTPAPTPAPPPPTYTEYNDLTGNQSFASAGYQENLDGNNSFTFQNFEFSDGVETNFTAKETVNVGLTLTSPDGQTETFTPADNRNSSIPGELAFEKRDAAGNITSSVSISTPQVSGVDLTYTRFGSWVVNDPATGESIRERFVLGVSTVASDVPQNGTATYDAEVSNGLASTGADAFNITGSSATFFANFVNGEITTSIDLFGNTLFGGPDRSLGTVNGTGTISNGGPGFSGVFSGGQATDGFFLGAFFGPQAQEFGYQFRLEGIDPATGLGMIVFGAVAGREQ